LSFVLRFFLSESQIPSVPKAEMQRPRREKRKRGGVFFRSVRTEK